MKQWFEVDGMQTTPFRQNGSSLCLFNPEEAIIWGHILTGFFKRCTSISFCHQQCSSNALANGIRNCLHHQPLFILLNNKSVSSAKISSLWNNKNNNSTRTFYLIHFRMFCKKCVAVTYIQCALLYIVKNMDYIFNFSRSVAHFYLNLAQYDELSF